LEEGGVSRAERQPAVLQRERAVDVVFLLKAGARVLGYFGEDGAGGFLHCPRRRSSSGRVLILARISAIGQFLPDLSHFQKLPLLFFTRHFGGENTARLSKLSVIIGLCHRDLSTP
jgi:hypothetical protein